MDASESSGVGVVSGEMERVGVELTLDREVNVEREADLVELLVLEIGLEFCITSLSLERGEVERDGLVDILFGVEGG
jgi:hypothetical protein